MAGRFPTWPSRSGVPMLSSSDTEFGTVEHVLQIPVEDLFDGIVVKTKQALRFVDRDQITTTFVRSSLSDEDAANVPAPRGTLVLRPDTARDEGPSLSAPSDGSSGARSGRSSSKAVAPEDDGSVDPQQRGYGAALR